MSKPKTAYTTPSKPDTAYSVGGTVEGIKLNDLTVTLNSLTVRLSGYASDTPNFLNDKLRGAFSVPAKLKTAFSGIAKPATAYSDHTNLSSLDWTLDSAIVTLNSATYTLDGSDSTPNTISFKPRTAYAEV